MDSFKSKLESPHDKIWGHHVIVPIEIANKYLELNDKRIICNIEDQFEFSCALIAKGDGNYFISINKQIRTKFKLEHGTELDLKIRTDDSKYGMPLPEEMAELMAQDPEGEASFHKLTPGKQRSLLYLIGKPKSSQKRLEKAIVILEHLKINNGSLDFKLLNQAFKDFKF